MGCNNNHTKTTAFIVHSMMYGSAVSLCHCKVKLVILNLNLFWGHKRRNVWANDCPEVSVAFVGRFSQNCEKSLLASSCQSVHNSACPSVRMEQLRISRGGFPWNLNLSVFQKSVKKIQVSLKLDKSNGHFTTSSICIFYHISLNYSQNY